MSSRLRQIRRSLYPDLPRQFLPRPRRMAGVIRQQQIYSSLYRAHLEWLQCFSEAPSSPIHLTFYPIAKNLRLIGTALHDGVRAGRKVHIAPGNPREAALLRATGRGQWNPWLWSRIPRGQLDNLSAAQDDSARAWPTFFVAPDAPVSPPFGARPARPAWRQPGGRRTRRILETGACISYAFRLNPHMQAVVADHASRIGWGMTSQSWPSIFAVEMPLRRICRNRPERPGRLKIIWLRLIGFVNDMGCRRSI